MNNKIIPIKQGKLLQIKTLDSRPYWDLCRKHVCLCHSSRNDWSWGQQSGTRHLHHGICKWQYNVADRLTRDVLCHQNFLIGTMSENVRKELIIWNVEWWRAYWTKKDWIECIKQDPHTHNLNNIDPHNRKKWTKQIRNSLVLPTPDSEKTAPP